MRTRLFALLIAGTLASAIPAYAQTRPSDRPLQVEWVYHVKYGYQGEWWKLFQKYQIATLDREKQLGYVTDYQVFRPGAHTSEDSRWDYRIIITYPNYDGSKARGRGRGAAVSRTRRHWRGMKTGAGS